MNNYSFKKIFSLIIINILVFTAVLYLALNIHQYFNKNKLVSSLHRPSLEMEFELTSIPSHLFKKNDDRLLKFSISDHDNKIKYPKNYFHTDIIPGQKFNVVAKIKNTDLLVYDVNYVFDRQFVRHVENQDQKKNAKNFVLTAGCSLTFGEGITQGDDYPSQLAHKLDSSWKVHNYGFHGNGPNNYIDRVQKNLIDPKLITEQNGVFIWLYISDHLNRYFCPLNCYNADRSWNLELPEIKYSNDMFQSEGPFRLSKNPFRLFMYFLKKFHFFDHIQLPEIQYSNSQYTEFVKAVDYMPQLIGPQIKYKYFIFLDNFGKSTDTALIDQFVKLGYKTINLTPYWNLIPIEQRTIAGDGHFSAATDWIISEIVAAEIKKNINLK